MFGKRREGSNPKLGGGADIDRLSCSFCKKSSRAVAKLVAGPGVYISDECIGVCVRVMADDANQPEPPADAKSRQARASAAGFPQDTTSCSFCGRPARSNEVVSISERGVLCSECAGAIEDALAHGKPPA
jgi:hypothetical protein